MNDTTTPRRPAAPTVGAGTRAALLEAARACVRDHGVAGTTSRLITGAAGVNLAAITYHFGSKDELVAEALYGEMGSRLQPVLEQLEADAPAATRLLTAIQELLVEFDRSADDVPVYLNALVHGAESPAFGTRARGLLVELRARLSAVIAQLRADGAIAAWVHPEAMASLLISAGNGIALQSQLDPDGPGVEAMASQLAGLLLAAAPAA